MVIFRRKTGAGRRRKSVLMVGGSLRSKRRMAAQKTAVFFIVPMLLAGVVFFAWRGVVGAGRILFSGNPDYTITRLDINAGPVLGQGQIREWLRISEGTNIFAFSIADIHRDLLMKAPNIRSAEITRILPGTLKIDIIERKPIAFLGRRHGFVVDQYGYVFSSRSGVDLPVLLGYRRPGLKPGVRLGGMFRAALDVIGVCSDPRYGIRVLSIDAGRDDYLVMTIDGNKVIDLAWDGMGAETVAVDEILLRRISVLSAVLQAPESRERKYFKATMDDDRISGFLTGEL